ncbi:hypothetical protein BDFB_005908, partial [Asbolus verrucosus]
VLFVFISPQPTICIFDWRGKKKQYRYGAFLIPRGRPDARRRHLFVQTRPLVLVFAAITIGVSRCASAERVSAVREDVLRRMSNKCRLIGSNSAKPPVQKRWSKAGKKNDHIYENLHYRRKDGGQDKLKIVIDNFDKILDEYNTSLPPQQPKKETTKIPKLQKAKTCSIIESKCILKKSLSQPLGDHRGDQKKLNTKTTSLVDIAAPPAKTTSKVKEAVQRINLLNRSKSIHDVSVQDPRRPASKIPIKTPTLRKTFPSTPSGLNCLDRISSGSARKSVHLSLPPSTTKRDFVANKKSDDGFVAIKAPKEKRVKEVVEKIEANRLGNGRNTYRKSDKCPEVKLDLKVAQEFIEYLKMSTCENYYLDPKDFTTSKIFFRSGVLSQLESQRDERLAGMVVHLQANCRGFLARRRLGQRKLQDMAVRCIQRNVRKFLVVRDWPWWRLLVRVTPLLNVHRTEEELRMKTDELEALKSKLEKLESERTTLKHENDKLEAKVSRKFAEIFSFCVWVCTT